MESIDSQNIGASSVAFEPNAEWENSSTVVKLRSIVEKMLGGECLTSYEQAFLAKGTQEKQSSTQWASSFIWTPADEKTVGQINALRNQILTNRAPKARVLETLHYFLDISQSLSPREIAGLSQTLIDCQSQPLALRDLHEKLDGKLLDRETLAKELNAYNDQVLPVKDRAGEIVARFKLEADEYGPERDVILQFGRYGNLVVVDGPVMMMDHSVRQVLSADQIASLKDIYTNTAQDFHYNNMAILLEFAHFHNAHNLEGSLRDSFERFHPDLVDLKGKYRSGTCGTLAEAFISRAREQLGIEGVSVSHITENNWTVLPFPGTEGSPIKWNELSQEVHGFDHTDAAVLYKDERGRNQVLKFACSLERNNPDEVTNYTSVREFLMMNKGSEDYPLNQGVDNGEIAKTFIKARYKAVMMKEGITPQDHLIFGVDFLRGNVYMNKSWSNRIEGLPKDKNGFVSIPLSALAHPDERGVYFIDGKPCELTHREVLQIVLKKAAGEFMIPPNMEEGIIQLARMAPALSRELFMEPIPFLQENYADLQKIGKMINEVRPDITSEVNDPVKNLRYKELSNDYTPICYAIADGEFETAKKLIREFLSKFSG